MSLAEDLHETGTEYSIQGNLVSSPNLQLGNKLDREPDNDDISDDVEDRYRRIRRGMVAAGSLHARIPRHLYRLADEKSYQSRVQSPAYRQRHGNPGKEPERRRVTKEYALEHPSDAELDEAQGRGV